MILEYNISLLLSLCVSFYFFLQCSTKIFLLPKKIDFGLILVAKHAIITQAFSSKLLKILHIKVHVQIRILNTTAKLLLKLYKGFA